MKIREIYIPLYKTHLGGITNMEYAVIGIIVAAIIAVGVIFFMKMRKKPANKSLDSMLRLKTVLLV